jgi:hypothetical protein
MRCRARAKSLRTALLSLSAAALVLATATPIRADATRDAAVRDGNAMYEAFRDGDLDRFASYTYSGLIQVLGGKERMLELLRKGEADMAAEGYRFTSGHVAAPTEVLTAGPELHALLPLTQVLTAPGGELHVQGHLLGISADGGKTWTFIDTGRLTPENVRQVVPNFNPGLRLPGKAQARFIPK